MGMQHAAIACALVASACVVSSNDGSDGGSNDASSPGANVVTMYLSAGSTPVYIAYRNGTAGPWLTPEVASSQTGGDIAYALHVDNAYELVAVCASQEGTVDAEETDATFAGDGDTGSFGC